MIKTAAALAIGVTGAVALSPANARAVPRSNASGETINAVPSLSQSSDAWEPVIFAGEPEFYNPLNSETLNFESNPMEPANPSDFGYVETPRDFSASNLDAFLHIIRVGESTDDYTALVGGGNFTSFEDHPAELGWQGIKRADGRLTTAAGAYQIIRTTWRNLGGKKKYGSFDPQAQTLAAIDLIKGRGAYSDILAGRVADAVKKLKPEWEFLVTSRWPTDRIIAMFKTENGVLA